MKNSIPRFYAFDPFLLDVRRRLLLRDGVPVQLTPKALEMLVVLIEHREEVLEKEEMLKRVWPEQFVEEANLTVNMSALRKALGERVSQNQYIITVPRRGYRFVAAVRELSGQDLDENLKAAVAAEPAGAAAGPVQEATPPPPPSDTSGGQPPSAETPQPHVSYPNNLPIQFTPFIGRKSEVSTVEKLLRREEVRLLTLTGPGGTGKTRLALHVASTLQGEFADGTFFVPLEPIGDSGLVISAIAQTLGVKEAAGVTLSEDLAKFLRDKRVLLILDNFEQVISAAPLLSNLMSATRYLKILVTSRAVLRLSGEHEFQVPPLRLPNLSGVPRAPELLQYAAVELFVQRATAAKSDFTLTERNAHAVAEICVSLDGLPLAIELAAARIKLLPPKAMLARLETPLKLLTGGARNLPMRQQTMSGAIAWSYDLLGEAEKRLFRRFAVFAGGATLAAAEVVCNAALDLGMDVQDGVASLVDNSLLRQVEPAGGEPQFVMLETIREYGLECLKASGEIDQTRRNHANYFLEIAEEADLKLAGGGLESWLEQLEQEHDNLRAALRWSLETGQEETGLRLVGALWWFWYLHGHYHEGREWLNKVLAASGAEPSTHRAKALIGAGVLAFLQCEYPAAEKLLNDGLALSRQLGDQRSIALSLQVLGSVARERGEYKLAVARHQESLAICRELDDKRGIARSLNYIGFAAWLSGDFQETLSCCEAALKLFRGLGDKEGIIWSCLNLAAVAHYRQEHERATILGEEGLALSREIGYKEGIAWSFNILGDASAGLKRYAHAIATLQESLHLHHELGDRWRIASVLESLGGLASTLRETEKAAWMFAAAEVLRESVGAPLPPVERKGRDRHVKTLSAAVGKEELASLWAKGRTMRLEQIIACALELHDTGEHKRNSNLVLVKRRQGK